MTLRITIDIFSGRSNPVFEVAGRQEREILERMRPVRPLKRGAMPAPEFRLGYRGLIIEQTRTVSRTLPRRFRVAAGALYGPGFAHEINDPTVEEFCATKRPAARLKLPRSFPRIVRTEIRDLQTVKKIYIPVKIKWPTLIPLACRCAPLYEPAWWNDGGQRQWNNNCYNYATNYRSDTFAQPGRASGAMYTALTCASVRTGSIADALIDSPNADNKCPKEGHLVALVIWPGYDFHWYRKGRNGRWSHKPGGTPVTNLDNSSNLITDPQTADRGNYTTFCTFMTVMHGHIKIK
jgi:hypothetical protein